MPTPATVRTYSAAAEDAIRADAEHKGYGIDTARRVYDQCDAYARRLSPKVRASEQDVAKVSAMPLKAVAIGEVIRELD
ncbi:hypothetical protein ACFY0Z_30115 [Streptomyces kronopolitis]|uniref:hypothetical protein n=1 Tax=Streptomyces kronopolitis TaxID=1612435 RepID=UPI0036823564